MKKIFLINLFAFSSLILANFCYAQEASLEQGTEVNDQAKEEFLLKERNDQIIDYDNVGTSSIVYFFDGTPTDEKVIFNGESNYSSTVEISSSTYKVFNGLAFHKVDDVVYKIETDVVDKQIFDDNFTPKTSYLFVKTVYGDTVYAGGDGECYAQNTTWSTARSADSAYACNDGGSTDTLAGSWWNVIYIINRGFLNFNTDSLPNNAEISSSTLMVYVSSQTDDKNDQYSYIGLYESTQVDYLSPPSTSDFNNCGTLNNPVLLSEQKDITNLTAGSYHAFSINSEGLEHIDTSAYTKLCAREGHDVENQSVGVVNDSKVSIRYSSYAGTASDPYLLIDFTIPETGGSDLTGIGTSSEVYGIDIGKIYLNATSTLISSSTKTTEGKIIVPYFLFVFLKVIITISMLVVLVCLVALIYKKL